MVAPAARGRMALCTLDLESRAGGDKPMAEAMAARLIAHARTIPARAAEPAVLLGDDADGSLLDRLGITWQRADCPACDQCAGRARP